jgi:transcription termination factor Rho
VTDTQDQLSVLPSTGISATAGANNTAQERAKRRSGSLTTMLLPELQALAGSMGIATGKMRKSDLIAAIETAKRPSSAPAAASDTAAAPTTRTRRSATRPVTATSQPTLTEAPVNGSAANGVESGSALSSSGQSGSAQSGSAQSSSAQSSSAQSSSAQSDNSAASAADSSSQAPAADAAERRPRRTRSSAQAQPGSEAPVAEDTQVATDGAADARSDNGQAQQDRPERGSRRDGAARDGGARDGGARDGGPRDGGPRDGQGNRNNQNRDGSRDANSRDANNRDANSRDGGRNQNRDSARDLANGAGRNNGQANNSQNDDDDEFGGSRRGRRYRDRRGRTRDRVEGGQGGGRNDVEPTISEDDVLVPVAGILDNVDDKGSWFIRVSGYFASSDDVYVANNHIRRYNLRRGDAITGAVRQLRDGERKEKFNPLVRLDTVNGVDPEQARNRVEFTKLTPLYPQERLRLETEPHILTTRVIDLVMPIGKGQRALIVSPPKAGKTMIMQAIANAIATNNPECHLMVVLIDERPEEVTDMQRSVKGEVIASTFDRRPQDHTMVAELSIERAKRLVEMGHDVVVLLDSITRLGRAYNLGAPASGRILSGGVDSTALYPPKRFLGAARNIEDGGSLTIIASALVETGSAGDTVIFEEFKGTGNAELRLDRKIADKRVYPAVDVDQSSTRKEEILLSPDELSVVIKLRRVLHALDSQQGIDLLLDRLRKTRTNIEFLMQIAKTTPGADDR